MSNINSIESFARYANAHDKNTTNIAPKTNEQVKVPASLIDKAKITAPPTNISQELQIPTT